MIILKINKLHNITIKNNLTQFNSINRANNVLYERPEHLIHGRDTTGYIILPHARHVFISSIICIDHPLTVYVNLNRYRLTNIN